MPGKTISMTPSRATQNGYAIRAFREGEGLSVQALADAIGVTAPHLRNIENEHRNANARHLALIARTLGKPVAAIMRDYPAGAERVPA